jgi:hypothetical protein
LVIIVGGGATKAPGGTKAFGGTTMVPSPAAGIPPSHSHAGAVVRDARRNRLNQPVWHSFSRQEAQPELNSKLLARVRNARRARTMSLPSSLY